MAKKKLNPDLLSEELRRFKLLTEYDFYQERKEEPEYKDIILGSELDEADEDPNDFEATDDIESGASEIAADLDVDGENASEDTVSDIPEPVEPPVDEPMADPVSDEVEIDVTSLVKGTEEAKDAADSANDKSMMLLKKLSSLEHQLNNMDKITNKIEDLERELVKRNPTPVEKLEMRSLSSAPFNQKLSDYWADKEGAYDVMDTDKKKKEYVLTKDDVNNDYNDVGVKKTFSPDYEEETIDDYEVEDY